VDSAIKQAYSILRRRNYMRGERGEAEGEEEVR
jgi:hypothetical protein